MKKYTFYSFLIIAFFLVACSPQSSKKRSANEQPSTTVASETQTTTQKEETTTSMTTVEKIREEVPSQETSSPTTQEKVTLETVQYPDMNLEDIKQGRFASIRGTWKNAAGQTIVISEEGTAQFENEQPLKIVILPSSPQEDLVTWKCTLEGNNIIGFPVMTFVPKDHFVSYGLASGETDASDSSQDRFFGAQQALTTEGLKKSMFYRTSLEP